MLIRTKLFRTKNLKHLARVHADSYQISKLILLIQKVSQRRKHISSIDHEELMFTNDWKATGSPFYVFLCMDIRFKHRHIIEGPLTLLYVYDLRYINSLLIF